MNHLSQLLPFPIDGTDEKLLIRIEADFEGIGYESLDTLSVVVNPELVAAVSDISLPTMTQHDGIMVVITDNELDGIVATAHIIDKPAAFVALTPWC